MLFVGQFSIKLSVLRLLISHIQGNTNFTTIGWGMFRFKLIAFPAARRENALTIVQLMDEWPAHVRSHDGLIAADVMALRSCRDPG